MPRCKHDVHVCVVIVAVRALPIHAPFLGRRDIATLVQLGFAYHELCDFSQALAVYKKVMRGVHVIGPMDRKLTSIQ